MILSKKILEDCKSALKLWNIVLSTGGGLRAELNTIMMVRVQNADTVIFHSSYTPDLIAGAKSIKIDE